MLAGDDGLSTLEHVAAVVRALPDAQLAVVPGTSHGLPLEKPHLVNQLLLDFFADEQVPKMFALDDRTRSTQHEGNHEMTRRQSWIRRRSRSSPAGWSAC